MSARGAPSPGGARRRRSRCLAMSALVVLVLLGGCASRADLAPQAAGELQESVLEVTQAVADGRLEVAVAALADVRRELVAAADRGDVSATRYRLIDEALTMTEAQLAAAQQAAAEQAAAEQAAAQQAAVDQALAERAAAEQAAAEQAAAERAAAEEGADDEEGGPEAPGRDKDGPGEGGSGKGGDRSGLDGGDD